MKLQLVAVALVSAMLGGVFGIAVWRVLDGKGPDGAPSANASALEERVASLELEASRFRDPPEEGAQELPAKGSPPKRESLWQCPTGRDGGHCFPELHNGYPKEMPLARAWAARASLFAASGCSRKVLQDGGGCISTRFVVCSTHDNDANLCFPTWAACQRNVEEHTADPKPRRCAAYYAGRRLK